MGAWRVGQRLLGLPRSSMAAAPVRRPPEPRLLPQAGGGKQREMGGLDGARAREADLISGSLTDGGIDTLRITTHGMHAFDPEPRDPLDHATAQLRAGARVDAIVTGVEVALGTRLKLLAAARGVPSARPDGSPLKFSALNNALRAAGAYDEADRTQVEAWLNLRNDLAHAQGATPTDARIEAVIAGIRAFLAEHPAH